MPTMSNRQSLASIRGLSGTAKEPLNKYRSPLPFALSLSKGNPYKLSDFVPSSVRASTSAARTGDLFRTALRLARTKRSVSGFKMLVAAYSNQGS